MSGDPLTMDYFNNLDNESLNKYKINLKKKFIDVFIFKFYAILLSVDSSSKTIKLEPL
jgi:hypothetical protein